jgi:hypothetical protein
VARNRRCAPRRADAVEEKGTLSKMTVHDADIIEPISNLFLTDYFAIEGF